MAKIYIHYQIDDVKSDYIPGMNISGKIWIQNQDLKEKKLKKLEARVVEFFEIYETRKMGKVKKTQWWQSKKVIKKFIIAEKELLPSGSELEFIFNIDLPNWQSKSAKNIRNWWLGLIFYQKTGMIATQGINPLDATFVIPCKDSSVPLSIVKHMLEYKVSDDIMSDSLMTDEYSDFLLSQAKFQMETGDIINENTILRLKSMISNDDEIIFNAIAKFSVDLGAGTSRNWISPIIATRYGIAYISPSREYAGAYLFQFRPWTNIKKLKKGVKFGSQLDYVKGDIFFKTKRGIFGRIFLELIRDDNESRSEYKQRKNYFRKLLPELYNSGKKIQLFSEPVELTFQGASGLGEPLGQASESSQGSIMQSTPSNNDIESGTSSSSGITDDFPEDWDDIFSNKSEENDN
ncbi:MAG: hypothetical protein ACP6IY_02875 [Promethearchaeia archaeon]